MVTFRRAVEADLPRLCRTTVLAFADDPVMRWLYPDDEEYFADGGSVMRWTLLRWLQWGETWTTDDNVAVACWIPPGRPEVEVPEPFVMPTPERMEKFLTIGPLLEANTPDEPHWYLNLIGTHPDWQRQGIGAALIDVIAQRAFADGLPLYLETETVENVAYYAHLGFTVRSEWDVPTGPHMWGMFRPAPN